METGECVKETGSEGKKSRLDEFRMRKTATGQAEENRIWKKTYKKR
jgi:hypothetical protein